MSSLNGKWKLVACDANFDDVLKATGTDDASRAQGVQFLANTGADGLVEELELTATTGKRTLTSGGVVKGGKEFPLNVQFEAPGLDGRLVKTKITTPTATSLLREDTYANGANGQSKYELIGGKLEATMTVGGVTCKRTYTKQ